MILDIPGRLAAHWNQALVDRMDTPDYPLDKRTPGQILEDDIAFLGDMSDELLGAHEEAIVQLLTEREGGSLADLNSEERRAHKMIRDSALIHAWNLSTKSPEQESYTAIVFQSLHAAWENDVFLPEWDRLQLFEVGMKLAPLVLEYQSTPSQERVNFRDNHAREIQKMLTARTRSRDARLG